MEALKITRAPTLIVQKLLPAKNPKEITSVFKSMVIVLSFSKLLINFSERKPLSSSMISEKSLMLIEFDDAINPKDPKAGKLKNPFVGWKAGFIFKRKGTLSIK